MATVCAICRGSLFRQKSRAPSPVGCMELSSGMGQVTKQNLESNDARRLLLIIDSSKNADSQEELLSILMWLLACSGNHSPQN